MYKPKTNAEKKKELDLLAEKLKDGVLSYVESDQYKAVLDNIERFHDYSPRNSILIGLQKPDATHVASYTTWKQFNRVVNKGESGIAIYSPVEYSSRKEINKIDSDTGQQILDAKGQPVKEYIFEKKRGYKIAYVFDISQTTQIPGKKEYQFDLAKKLLDPVDSYYELYNAISSSAPCPITFEDIPSGANGYYSVSDHRIVVQKNLSESQSIKTLIHEIAHATLHGQYQSNSNEKISFYVSECSEFHDIGEYHEEVTFEEAVRIYKSIPSDRLNGIKEIGCNLYKNNEWIGELPLVRGDEIQLNYINSVSSFADSLEVNKAIMNLKKEFSDDGAPLRSLKELQAESVAYIVCKHFGIDTKQYSFGYIASWMRDENQLIDSLKLVKLCSQNIINNIEQSIKNEILLRNGIKSTEDMALRVTSFLESFDPYEFADQEIYKGSQYDQTLSLLQNGQTADIEKTFEDIIEEGQCEQSVREAKNLLKCVQTFQKIGSIALPGLSQERGMEH